MTPVWGMLALRETKNRCILDSFIELRSSQGSHIAFGWYVSFISLDPDLYV